MEVGGWRGGGRGTGGKFASLPEIPLHPETLLIPCEMRLSVFPASRTIGIWVLCARILACPCVYFATFAIPL